MATQKLDEITERVADALREQFERYEDYTLRIDAGEEGHLYIALREARSAPEVGERLADEVTPVIADVLADEPDPYDFALSIGHTDKDLLLLCEIRST